MCLNVYDVTLKKNYFKLCTGTAFGTLNSYDSSYTNKMLKILYA